MATEVTLPEAPQPKARPLETETIPKDGISVLDVLIILARKKRLIVLTTAFFTIGAIVVSLLWPISYTAQVTLLPPQNSSTGMSSMLASQLGNLGGMATLAGGSLGLKNPNDMYVAMMKSRTVEDAMVEHYGLMKEYRQKYLSGARRAWESKATVDGNEKDGLIHVSVEDGNPHRAAELANGYVEQFRKLSEHLAISEASQRRLFFEQQLQQAKENLTKAEVALKETEQKTGLIQLDSQARALIESAASLRAQIAAKEVQIQSLKTFATNENSQLIQAQQELDSLRSQLAQLVGNQSSPDAELIPSGGKVPAAGLEYLRKLRDVKYQETIFDILARQYEMAKLDEAKQGALIQVVDPAVPPDQRSSPHRSLIVVGCTVFGFLVGNFIALLKSGFERLAADRPTAEKLHALARALRLRKLPA